VAYCFGDGFDCYATTADALAGYWDSGSTSTFSFVAGRFTGSQALLTSSSNGVMMAKSSGVNDAVHHIICAVRQTTTLSGTNLNLYFQLSDAATNQVCIAFRTDGVILLTSATPAGTVLATYSGAVTAQNTWFAFEFEVVIHPTAGRFRARKNGNTVDDFDSGATLPTRPGANSYANKLSLGLNFAVTNTMQIDDVLWRSDASSVPFVGDIRCYTRMPASDASVQFARSPATQAITPFAQTTTGSVSAGTGRYTPFTATYDGTIGSATVTMATGYTGNMKCSIFASSGSAPTTVLGSATPLVNPAIGTNTFTFGTPVSVTKSAQYWIGFDSDTSSGVWAVGSGISGGSSTTAYAAFPVASPSTSFAAPIITTATLTVGSNTSLVNEAQQDGTTSYVYDSTVGHADFYNLAPLGVTPASVVATITRGFVCKSDAGTRSGAVQLKSGGTTVASSAPALSTSFGWLWRADTTDPATGSAWTPAGVNAATIGPIVSS
jgi:hypothetical protein